MSEQLSPRMHRHLSLLLLLVVSLTLPAQTVIDLRRTGVGVRGKDMHDYDQQHRDAWQLRQDSLEYVDCLTRGFNHLHADSLVAARQCFERALRLRPDAPGNHIVRRQLAMISMAEGKYAASIEEFSIILRQHPAEHEDRLNRASCYLSQEMPQQALDDCQALLKHPLDTAMRIRVLLLQSYAHKQLRQYHQVNDDLCQILAMNPRISGAQLLYAINLAEIGQPKESLNQLNLYISAHPRDAEALQARARLFYDQHNLVQAREDLTEAIQVAPSDASLYRFRAKILGEIGEKRLSQADQQRAALLSRSRSR